MPRVHQYHVYPHLPARLQCLDKLSLNLRWSWHHPTIELFRTLDADLWEETRHNPRLILGRIDQRRFTELGADEAFLAQMDRASSDLDDYLAGTGWFAAAHPEASGIRIAYFSAEFGLTECIPNYAGGLGILAGDHLKSASDLGLPMVGVGLLYQGGYFHQYLNADGLLPTGVVWITTLRAEHGRYSVESKNIRLEIPGRPVVQGNVTVTADRLTLPNPKGGESIFERF
jgi:glycogen phosphorylase